MTRSQEQQHRAPSTRSGLGYYLVMIGGVLLVLYFTLYPFQFSQFDRITTLHRYFSGITFSSYSRCCRELAVLEPLANVVLFLPFGIGLTGLVRQKTAAWSATFIRVLLLSTGFSLAIEILQVFQPHRTPSLTDLLMNSLGGCLGFLCVRAWRLWRNAEPVSMDKSSQN